MIKFEAIYEKMFVRNLRRYSSLKGKIKRRVEKIIENPYNNTESLADITKRLNLIGCRSARIDRNFRIVFVICEEFGHKRVPVAALPPPFCAGELDRTARLNKNMGYSTHTGLRHIQAYKLVQPIENMLKRHKIP